MKKLKIAFRRRRGGDFYARDSILRFIVRGSDRFELCADGDSRCDIVVVNIQEANLFFKRPTEWDRLVREIGSTDRKPVVVLDCSDEAWPPFGAFKAKVAETLQDTNPKIRRVVFLTHNRLFFRDGEMHQSHGAGQIEYVYFHGWLAKIAAELRGLMEKNGGACLENMFANRVEAWKSSSPRFVCLMRKPREHRIVVMGHLIRTGALRHGNVSFLSHIVPRNVEAGQPLENMINHVRGRLRIHRWTRRCAKIINHARERFPRFSDEIDALAGFAEAKHGFRNFEDDAGNHLSIGIGANASRDTQVELVVETEMTDGSALITDGSAMRELDVTESSEPFRRFRRFTEKSLRAPLLWHAFLVCGNRSTLPLLEEVGLGETGFGGDYDSVRDPQERLKAVLDTFGHLEKLQVTTLLGGFRPPNRTRTAKNNGKIEVLCNFSRCPFDDFLSGSLKLDEGYLWRNRDIHARFLAREEENAAKSMNALSRILLDEL